jgi:undecaprenyl-diphosphatase
MDTFFIFCAKYLFVLSILIGLVWFIKIPKSDKKRWLIIGLISLAITYIIGKIASLLYYNPRPFVSDNIVPLIQHAANNGFPSDHTLLVSAIASVVTLRNRTWGLVLWLIAILVGYSRVYVGIHHITDIVGAVLIALTSTLIVYFVQNRKKNVRIVE